jgi:monofunctional biosynthetic peptidoglycan transglycosylase
VLIEALWPKRRILEVYLNIAQFGPSTFGAEAASHRFFRKPAAALSRSEAALLVAVLPNPHDRRVDQPDRALRYRQLLILGSMNKLGPQYLARLGRSVGE